MTMELSRDNAWNLLNEYVKEAPLIRHCLSVEACMREYARLNGEDEERWGFVGLIHDFDFEMHPTLDQHPQDGAPILRDRGVPEELVQDVLSHADHLDVPRDTLLRKTLAAVDETSSFVVAVALVRPSRSLDDLEPKSVKKKMKDKAFARAVDRQAMLETAEELGVDFDTHLRNVINGLKPIAHDVGLQSETSAAMSSGD
jgi:putative nucleotidyltransferase with HDIG domain